MLLFLHKLSNFLHKFYCSVEILCTVTDQLLISHIFRVKLSRKLNCFRNSNQIFNSKCINDNGNKPEFHVRAQYTICTMQTVTFVL